MSALFHVFITYRSESLGPDQSNKHRRGLQHVYRAFPLSQPAMCVRKRPFYRNWGVCTEGDKPILFVQAISLSFKYIIQASFNFNSEVEAQLRKMPNDGDLFILEGVWVWKRGKGLDTVRVAERGQQDILWKDKTGVKTRPHLHITIEEEQKELWVVCRKPQRDSRSAAGWTAHTQGQGWEV